MELVKARQMPDSISHRRIFKADETRIFNAFGLSETGNHGKVIRIF
jgi:hypothetical protein